MADRNLGTIDFELVSPATLMVSEPVYMVVVPGAEGDIGVLPGHSPLIATVRPGVMELHEPGKIKDRIFVGGGFVEVSPERCTVLAEEAIPVAKIDPIQAETRLAEVRKNAAASDEKASKEAMRQIMVAEGLVAAAKHFAHD